MVYILKERKQIVNLKNKKVHNCIERKTTTLKKVRIS